MRLWAELNIRSAIAVITPKANPRGHFDLDHDIYGWRHLIESLFTKLKEFRAIATRHDETDTSFHPSINFAAALIASR